MKTLNVLKVLLGLSVAVSFLGPVFAGEDDGRPYSEIAKRVGPKKADERDPITAMHYDYWAPLRIREYLEQAEKNAGGGPKAEAVDAVCSEFHRPYLRDGVLSIQYALGYFDESTGKHIVYENLDWGLSPSYDEGVWMGIREVMLAPCPNADRRLCGFRELTSEADRKHDGKTVLGREMNIQGKSTEVRFTLTYASASPFFERNKNDIRVKQERFTRTSENNFFERIRDADYVIYMGHSRNGGGPDFNPPRLNSLSLADYNGYYRKQTPGISRLVRELKTTPNPDVAIGLFSCDSDLHFRKRLLATNPRQRMMITVGSVGRLNYYDTMNLSMAYIEGLLRGSCGDQLDNFARATQRDKELFRSFNMK